MGAEARVESARDGARAESKEGATTSTFSIPPALVAQATSKFEQAHPGQRATSQRVIDFALDQHLSEIRISLRRLGFRNHPLGKPKPRRISKRALEALKCVSSESGISAAAILRACLEATR
jgi:hypothetical protein